MDGQIESQIENRVRLFIQIVSICMCLSIYLDEFWYYKQSVNSINIFWEVGCNRIQFGYEELTLKTFLMQLLSIIYDDKIK